MFAMLLLCVLGAEAVDLLRIDHTTAAASHPALDVRCLCSSVPNGTLCSWAEPPQDTPLHYIATYSERLQQNVTRSCRLLLSGDPLLQHNTTPPASTHKVWTCHVPDVKLLTDYILNVTTVSPSGSSSYLSSFMMEDIVKPDPPVDVRVSSPDPRTLLVQWSPPPSWSHIHIFPLKYRLQYQWWSRGQLRSHQVSFEGTRAPLKSLVGGRMYQIQLCAKDALSLGHCSDWSPAVNASLPLV
uniref:Fibronectin type-III domain-containing protein n=1 Tax=Knipowitschia caucasica TaxID=637954 RepID=A0AAV2JGS2_KNICA